MVVRLAVVGLGKIAQDQHLPAIMASDAFELVCGASLEGQSPRGRTYRDVATMLEAERAIEAVILCQPPQARFEAARLALLAGKHVLLEKPPGGALCEVEALVELAAQRRRTLFAAWHSRYAPAVAPARAWLQGRTIRSVEIVWREDVRVWHPGQQWIWRSGGLGVFDPGINALSIATDLLPSFRLLGGTLDVPSNQQSPIAAKLNFATVDGAPIKADFDFRQTGEQTWTISIATDGGTLGLSEGGAQLAIDGVRRELPAPAEYPALYGRFAALVALGASDVDSGPLRQVADAFLRAERIAVEPFHVGPTPPQSSATSDRT